MCVCVSVFFGTKIKTKNPKVQGRENVEHFCCWLACTIRSFVCSLARSINVCVHCYIMRWDLIHKYLSGWMASYNRFDTLCSFGVRDDGIIGWFSLLCETLPNVIYRDFNNRWCHWCCYDRLLPFLYHTIVKSTPFENECVCK